MAAIATAGEKDTSIPSVPSRSCQAKTHRGGGRPGGCVIRAPPGVVLGFKEFPRQGAAGSTCPAWPEWARRCPPAPRPQDEGLSVLWQVQASPPPTPPKEGLQGGPAPAQGWPAVSASFTHSLTHSLRNVRGTFGTYQSLGRSLQEQDGDLELWAGARAHQSAEGPTEGISDSRGT